MTQTKSYPVYIAEQPEVTSYGDEDTLVLLSNNEVKRIRPQAIITAVSPRIFGAVADGVADDTAAVQAAIDFAAPLGIMVDFGSSGIYRLKCAIAPVYTYGNSPTTNVYRAININYSNLRLRGSGAVLRLEGQPDGINYVFATAKNMTLATLTDLSFDGLILDFLVVGGTVTPRSFSLIGCRRVNIRNCRFYSSGTRAGATITIQNSDQVYLTNLQFNNTTQGMNFRFVENVVMSDLRFDNFSEAIDFDSLVDNVSASNIHFINGGTVNQCWDINDCKNVAIRGVYARNCGNVFLINYKSSSPPNYADYVNQVPPSVLTPSKGVYIEDVRIESCGTTAVNPIQIGEDRASGASDPFAGYPPVSNIVLKRLRLTGSGRIYIYEGINVVLEDVYMKDVLTATTGNTGAAIYGTKQTWPDSVLSITLRNVEIENTPFRGVYLGGCLRLIVNGLKITGYNSSAGAGCTAAHFPTLNECKSGYIDGLDIGVGLGTTPIGCQLQGTAGGYVYWGDNNRLLDALPVSAGGVPAYLTRKIDHSLASGLISAQIDMHPRVMSTTRHKLYVAWRTIQPRTALAADPTNYITWATRKNLSGADTAVNSGNFSAAGLTAGVELALGTTVVNMPTEGDFEYLRLNKAGTGGTLPESILRYYVLPYISS